jgi:hypothetical protein
MAKQFAKELRAQYEDNEDEEYITAVLNHFRTEEFYYTLTPALLGDDSVDEFLFSSRQGFCEHYASSFTYLMRAAGIPARVVTGYQGGELNPYDRTLTVRQYDAHAWSEVWLPERGWVRFDPTAAVAPERISQGSDVVFQEDENFMNDEVFSLMRFRSNLLLNNIRFRLEMIDYAWNRFVLNYDEEMQSRFFAELLGSVTKTKIILTIVGFMVLFTVFIAVTMFRKPIIAPKSLATTQYLRYCNYLAGLGIARQVGETPGNYLRRVSKAHPNLAGEMQSITEMFVELAFASPPESSAKLQRLRRSVREFRLLSR